MKDLGAVFASARRMSRHSVGRFAGASLVTRSLTVGTALLLTPLALTQLGTADYGVWVLASTVPSLVAAPDLGLGFGLVNRVATTFQRTGSLASERSRLLDTTHAAALVALAWFLVGAVALLMYWRFAAPSEPAGRVLLPLLTSLLIFTLQIPATIGSRGQFAHERGHVAVLWEAVGRSVTLIASTALLLLHPTVLGLVIVFAAPQLLTSWINACLELRRLPASPTVAPARGAWRQLGESWVDSRFFVAIQLLYILNVALDPFLISIFENDKSVTYFNVTRRPLELMPVAIAMASTALWPVFVRLRTTRDMTEVRRAFHRMLAAGVVICTAVSTLTLVAHDWIYDFIGAGQVTPHMSDIISTCIAISAGSILLFASNYLFAANLVSQQAIIMAVTAIASLPVKIFALRNGDVSTFMVASAAVFVVSPTMPLIWLAMRDIGRLPVGKAIDV